MMGVMTEWNRISDHAISSGNWTISKALLDGTPRYTLWEGERVVGIFKTPEEAKAMAEKESYDIPA